MDYLREGIHLRGFAQIEPLVAYKNEAFDLFSDLMNTIWSDFARMIYNVEVEVEGERHGERGAVPPPRPRQARHGRRERHVLRRRRHRAAERADAPRRPAASGRRGRLRAGPGRGRGPAPVVEQRRVDEHEQIGRNDPCWCGAGKKYKKCHGA